MTKVRLIETQPMSGEKKAKLYELDNGTIRVNISDYGATVVSIFCPDKNGECKDVVLGYEKLIEYEDETYYLGALCGRVGNRIKGAKFELNGETWQLTKNVGDNMLHGGIEGFNKKYWDTEIIESGEDQFLECRYLSPDGEEGFPGNLEVKVIYGLGSDNSLTIDYYAVSDKDTIVNLTNHSYFNLSGHDSGAIYSHKLKINGDKYLELDKNDFAPTGKIKDVAGTPYDFTEFHEIGERIDEDYPDLMASQGYDAHYIFNDSEESMPLVCEVFEEKSGRKMNVYTDQPGAQLYTGNYLGKINGKDGAVYDRRHAFCIETQQYPDAANHSNFPSVAIKSGEEYTHHTRYQFEVIKK